jgi:hypothetical protein
MSVYNLEQILQDAYLRDTAMIDLETPCFIAVDVQLDRTYSIQLVAIEHFNFNQVPESVSDDMQRIKMHKLYNPFDHWSMVIFHADQNIEFATGRWYFS